MNALLVRLALVVDLVLFSLRYHDDDPAVSLSTGSSHPLYEADGTLGRIKTDNEVDFTDVKTFLSNTRSNQRVVTTLTKFTYNLKIEQSDVTHNARKTNVLCSMLNYILQ